MTRVLLLDQAITEEMIRERKRLRLDCYDEVWEGVYVIPSVPSLAHQKLVHAFEMPLDAVVLETGLGEVYPGANVSDRHDWKSNYRVPDVVVLLNNGSAEARDTYILGGPDFIIEITSPNESPEDKLSFYSGIRVRELLVVHRDTRHLTLYRHDGEQLEPVELTDFQGKRYLVSKMVALAFRRTVSKGKVPRVEVLRTDSTPGSWTI